MSTSEEVEFLVSLCEMAAEGVGEDGEVCSFDACGLIGGEVPMECEAVVVVVVWTTVFVAVPRLMVDPVAEAYPRSVSLERVYGCLS